MSEPTLRPYRDSDHPALCDCFIALQDHEHAFDPEVETGAQLVDSYVPFMLERAERPGAHLIVAELDGAVVGFVTALVQPRAEPDDPDLVHVEIGELSVLESHRGQGLGHRLIEAAAQVGTDGGATSLRVKVRAANTGARRLYAREGFGEDYLVLSRTLG